MPREEEIQVLNELGLTFLQANAFLALVSLGETTAGNVADFSKIARQEVYRIIEELSGLGLVSKIVANPTRYKSLTFSEGVSLLLERQMKKTDKLKTKVGNLLEKKTTKRKKEQFKDYHFEMLPKQTPWFKNRTFCVESYKQFDLLTSFKRLSSRIIFDQEVFMKAAKKGTKIRILTQKPPPNSPIIPIIIKLRQHPNLEIRFLKDDSIIVLTIMDQKEAALALTPTDKVGPPYLVSNHPSFVRMAQQHFEVKWKEAKEVELPKA